MERREKSNTELNIELSQVRQRVAELEEERAAKLSRFFDLSLDMLCVASFDGYFVHLNPTWSTVLGYSKEELKAIPFLNLVHADDYERTRQAVQNLFAGEKALQIEHRYRCKDGQYRWLSWDATPVMDTRLIYAVVRDITEHRDIEAKLLEREALYRQMFEKHPSIRLLIDPQTGAIVDANPAAEQFYGYSLLTLKQMNISDLNNMSAEAVALEMMQAKTQARNYFIFQHRLASGDIRHVEVHSHPIDVQGKTLLYSVIHDITDRKQAETALQKQSQFQKAWFNHAGYAIISTDMDGVIRMFNKEASRILGYDADELIGKHTPLIFHKETEVIKQSAIIMEELGLDIEPGFAVLVAKSLRNMPNEHEWTYIRKDGTELLVRLKITAMRDAQGNVDGFIGIAKDITTERQLEFELEQHRHHLEKLVVDRTRRLELIGKISGELNAAGELNQLLAILVNHIQTTFGYYHVHVYLIEEETGDLVMFEGSGEVGQLLKHRGHRLASGQGIVGTVASGDEYFVSNNVGHVPNFFRNPLLPNTQSELAVPIRRTTDEGDKIIGVLDIQDATPDRFSSQDISMMQSIADQTAIAIVNVRLLEERQETIARLKEVDRAKSQFITMVSHELRTPLNAINGFSELMLLGLSGDLSDQVRDDVQIIHDSGQHLLTLIDDILDIAKMESGQIRIDAAPVAAFDLIEEVVRTSEPFAQEKKNVAIKLDIADNLPPIWADHTRVKQILQNLISNAIKFTNEGHVLIKVTDNGDNKARFAVIDTGIGIPPDKRRQIFEHFQQADMSDARQYGGTGLGLTICKQLVELHHGVIDVRSKEGVGSEFFFTIPFVS